MTRWQYLCVTWEYSTQVVGDQPRTWANRYFLRRDGGEATALPEGLDWVKYLNELGSDGWELVTERMQNSVVFGGQELGWSNVAGPVRMVFTFKRPVASDAVAPS